MNNLNKSVEEVPPLNEEALPYADRQKINLSKIGRIMQKLAELKSQTD
jgi:hypothetical protein